jgi:steroid delta-isomerase-like uncharacterized protein
VTRDEMNQVIEEHFRAEVRGDAEATLATFAEDVVHDVVGRPENPLVGKEAVRTFYANLFDDLAFEKFDTMHRYFGDNFAVDDAMVDARVVRGPQGSPVEGRRLRFRFLHVFEFRDGLISRENDWLDEMATQRQLAN